jgi:hypothetical protein
VSGVFTIHGDSTPPRGPFLEEAGATVLNYATNRYPPVGSRRATDRCSVTSPSLPRNRGVIREVAVSRRSVCQFLQVVIVVSASPRA